MEQHVKVESRGTGSTEAVIRPPMSLSYSLGLTMNTPRSYFLAEALCTSSISTLLLNTTDLTEHVYACSREDSVKFIPKYLRDHIYKVR